jgi:uncharacterized protein
LELAISKALEAPDGGFYDRAPIEEALGRLEVPDRPIGDNGLMAESLLRLAALTGEIAYRDRAERVLVLYAKTFASAGSFGSTYARALRRYLSPEVVVKVVAGASAGADFREVAKRLPGAFTAVRTLAPGEGGLPASPAPAAYVCRGTACAAPVTSASNLREAYDSLGG